MRCVSEQFCLIPLICNRKAIRVTSIEEAMVVGAETPGPSSYENLG